MESKTKMIEVRGLKKSFGNLKVLDKISFDVEKGQATAVIGPSGSGKSTMLRCVIDLERAEGGDIVIEDEYLCKDGIYPKEQTVSSICSKMGMVFQHFNLFPHMSVRGNLLCAPRVLKKCTKKQMDDKCHFLLNKVGLEDKIDEMPVNLSGGQKQRVAIARALMLEPDILLFDEPTSALDPELTGEVLETIKSLIRDKITMIIVTHEMGFAREAASNIIFMDKGIIVEEGAPANVLDNPQNERTQLFLKKIY